MKLNATREQMTDALKAVIAERGNDYVYPKQGTGDSCFYVHQTADGTDTPGCLIGAALHRLGTPLSDLKRFEGLDALWVADQLTTLDCQTQAALSRAQGAQDEGSAWGECLGFYLARIGDDQQE